MPYFFGNFACELIDGEAASGRGIWQLTEPLVYHSDLVKGDIVVPVGFRTDFASVPRVPIAFLLLGDTASEAACLHDWLYSRKSGLPGEPDTIDRATCDLMLREAARCTGVPAWRRFALYYGVRMFGGAFYKEVKPNA